MSSFFSKTTLCVTALCLTFLLVSSTGCDLGRNPDDADTNLVGIFDPDTQQLPLKGMVDLSLEREASGLNIVVGQAAFTDIAQLALPALGSCRVYEGLWARTAIGGIDTKDAGKQITLDNGCTSIDIPRIYDTAAPGQPELLLYRKIDILGLGWESDSVYDLRMPGGADMGSFDKAAVLKSPRSEDFRLIEPDLRCDIRVAANAPSPLELRWESAGGSEDEFILLRILPLDQTKQIVCNLCEEDLYDPQSSTASFTVSPAQLAQLPIGSGLLLLGRVVEKYFKLNERERAVASSSYNLLGSLTVGIDADRDGFLSMETEGRDCDDHDPSVNPDADEICDDGIDNDCDDRIDGDDRDCFCTDVDGDKYYIEGGICGDEDCDDDPSDDPVECLEDPSYSLCAAAIHPYADEILEDGVDNDCDGRIDEEGLCFVGAALGQWLNW